MFSPNQCIHRISLTLPAGSLRIRREPQPRNLVEPAPGFHYKVSFQGDFEGRGFADVSLHRAGQFSKRESLYSALVQNGLDAEDKVADLVNFYPHGRRTEGHEAQMFRKGIGSALFSTIISDCTQSEVKAMIVYATSIEMKFFLEKQSFEALSSSEKTYLRVLTASQPMNLEEISLSFGGARRD